MYGGMCHGNYVLSTIKLVNEARRYGVSVSFDYLFNESLITRGRNILCEEFLQSECTHMMFIDSDIAFDASDVIMMLGLSGTGDYDILAGTYPKKAIAWEKVLAAAKEGLGDENPKELEKYTGDYVLNFCEGVESFRVDEPVQVEEAGTGFMLYPRSVLEKMMDAYPENQYIPDNAKTPGFEGEKPIQCFFDCDIDPESRRYLSEDYWFCRKATAMGLKVWVCPWMNLTHYGTLGFRGEIGAFTKLKSVGPAT